MSYKSDKLTNSVFSVNSKTIKLKYQMHILKPPEHGLGINMGKQSILFLNDCIIEHKQ